jgi:hypothetical protein
MKTCLTANIYKSKITFSETQEHKQNKTTPPPKKKNPTQTKKPETFIQMVHIIAP